MNKTEIKTEFYNLLSVLKDEGIDVVGFNNENFNKTPLVAYKMLPKVPRLIQNRIERDSEWYFLIQIYANSSVQATEISDKIDNILKPKGFQEFDFNDDYSKEIGKFVITSVYVIRLDENGITYNLI